MEIKFTGEIGILAAALVVSSWLMIRHLQIHRLPSVVGAVFVTLFLMHGITAVPYAMGLVQRNDVYFAVTDEFPIVVAASFFFYAIGATATASALRFRLRQERARFLHQPMSYGAMRFSTFFITMVIALMIGLLFAFATGQTGLSVLLNQTRREVDLRAFRQGFRAANAYFYWGSIINNVIGPILLLIALNRARLTGLLSWWGSAAALFVMLLFTSTAALHKEPVAVLLLFIIANAFLVRSDRPRTANRGLLLVALALVSVVGMGGYYLTYDISPAEALSATVYRFLVVPQLCLDSFLYVYPHLVPHDGGLGVGLVATLAGKANYVNPSFLVGALVTGEEEVSSNAFWSSEMWASFGMWGVVVGSLAAGALMVLLDRHCLGKKKTATTVALYAYLIVAAIRMPSGSLFTSLLSGGMITGPVFVAILDALSIRRSAVPFAA